ncbi:hypothetical protein PsYK624_098650 [Phanerochaete sordida]|uniref:Uncharacterized protein n=1 Tax=Phanerochaete sordida TaxID=48140 RepID=A0A9P3GG67_9APHY|nr:hypothetical protein PsYK624_098650 [Phanerochaete sordida]
MCSPSRLKLPSTSRPPVAVLPDMNVCLRLACGRPDTYARFSGDVLRAEPPLPSDHPLICSPRRRSQGICPRKPQRMRARRIGAHPPTAARGSVPQNGRAPAADACEGPPALACACTHPAALAFAVRRAAMTPCANLVCTPASRAGLALRALCAGRPPPGSATRPVSDGHVAGTVRSPRTTYPLASCTRPCARRRRGHDAWLEPAALRLCVCGSSSLRSAGQGGRADVSPTDEPARSVPPSPPAAPHPRAQTSSAAARRPGPRGAGRK